ncbi:MAG: 3-oxoacyl-[acyl-carrier-protein] synthase 3 [Legionellaceae bacterium]
MNYSRIIGTGSYLPEKIITNFDLQRMIETTDEWIVERTGIRQRHIAGEQDTASTMAAAAARKALSAANLEANDIDLIVVATSTAEKAFPSAACLVQQHLGIKNQCPAFDIVAACAGFNYALAVVNGFIRTGIAKNALVIGSEIMSRIIDWTDRSTCILFGDGAGAVILSANEQPGIISTHLHADGHYKDLLYATNNPTAASMEVIEAPYLKMRGNELFKIAVQQLGHLVTETLAANNLPSDAIRWLIPHQANLRIITATAKKLNLSMEQVIVTVDQHGNTSSASVPLALDVGIRDGRIQRGDILLLESFGGGLAWGSALIEY